MLGILALLLVKDHQKTKDQLRQSFDERIINCTYTIEEHLLGIAVCSLIILLDYPQSLTNADILGQGNLNLVREKSGNFTFYNLWEPCQKVKLYLFLKVVMLHIKLKGIDHRAP